MIAMYVFAAAALVLAGAAIGILVVVCLGIKQDDRLGAFPAGTDDRTARAARKMTGAGAQTGSRRPRLAAGRTSAGLAGPWRLPPAGEPNEDLTSPGQGP